MKKIFVFKLSASLLLSFLIMTAFCSVYYNVPVHHENKDGATDYSWEKNVLYSSMTEGFGYGKTNNEGYMNSFDYTDETRVDVLIMGSSHLQGLAIPQNKNCASILNDMLENKCVYNISIAGHNLKTVINNLENALTKYKPETVIIEADNLLVKKEEIDKTINNEIPEISSTSSGLVNLLQHNPFLRLMYSQIKSLAQSQGENNPTYNISEIDIDKDSVRDLFKYLQDISKEHNTNIVIFYNPAVFIDENGEMQANKNNSEIETYESISHENGIYFIDISERYLNEYRNYNIVPTGFNNTGITKGHINADGHRMLAEELLELLKEID